MKMKALAIAWTVATVCAAPVGAQHPDSARVVPIQVTGDPAVRFTLVVMGDGYTAAEQDRYRTHLDKHLNVLWSLEPFRSYRNYINVYSVEILSPESGITCDPAHREPRTTPIALQFGGGCENPNARGITPARGEQEAARRYARLATPDYDQILVLANTDTYGGIGGSIATTSGGNALGPYITPHELGHSLGRLQDEYTYSARGVQGRAFDGEEEPRSIHHSLLTEDEMRAQQAKWFRWLGEPSHSGGLIGRFEGGQQRSSGVWRPSKHSMMISLGYYFDQVSLERMAQRISGQVELIAAARPADSPAHPSEVLWIETPQPNFHPLEITWEADGQRLPVTGPNLDLETLGSTPRSVTVRVVDPTDFVRDPGIRDTSFSATRTWTVAPTASAPVGAAEVGFTASTQTGRAVSGEEVVYVATSHPADRVLNVTWRVDGRDVTTGGSDRTLDLEALDLAPGTHRLEARLSDPAAPGLMQQTLEWTVDATLPTVEYTLSEPDSRTTDADGTPHYHFTEQFTLMLEPTDDQPGYVVGEFRLNGDGWHHYYGWPDAPPGTPFLFTPSGTTIKELVYGSLSAEGLSPQPWEERAPGYGTHTLEVRARDAAGNIGAVQRFRVTVSPGQH
jgi:hypothetical protein